MNNKYSKDNPVKIILPILRKIAKKTKLNIDKKSIIETAKFCDETINE